MNVLSPATELTPSEFLGTITCSSRPAIKLLPVAFLRKHPIGIFSNFLSQVSRVDFISGPCHYFPSNRTEFLSRV